MIDDQIRLAIQNVRKLKEELRQIKKDLREEEKIDSPEYIDLEKALKDLKKQVKDYKDQWMLEMQSDEDYNKLRELRIGKEEEIAEQNAKLFELVAKLPQKPVEMNMDGENGPIRIQIMPEMKLYLNGREEKRRA
jgi:ribosomal protein S21